MMRKLTVLVGGELSRLKKYGIFTMSIFVAVMWGVILLLVGEDILSQLLPLILLIDATMMSIMYIGALMHFEKSESTISSILVTPATNSVLVASKTLANIIHNTISSAFIVVAFYVASNFNLISNIDINIILLLLGVVITTSAFTIIGLIISYYQKDFTSMLVNIFIIGIILMIPSILLNFNIISGKLIENLMLINPVEAAKIVIEGGFNGFIYTYKYYISLAYITIGSILLYFLIAVPKFREYAIKESGV